ncbi:MAG: DUF4384 domain-containing protein [Myxococcales bacterium]|nr:DUF4384 domain-containing protein [Myxococcales bacterium]
MSADPRGDVGGGCPSDFALDAFELEGRPVVHPLRQHLAACPRCQERMEERDQARQVFRREVYPLTVEAVVAAGAGAPAPGARRTPWLLRWALGGAAALALVLVGLWIGWPHPDPNADGGHTGLDGIKGPPAIQVFVKRGERVFEIREGEPLRPKDRIRFVVSLPRPGYLRVLSLNGDDATSYYPPPGATPVRLPAGRQELPGATELDERAGPERLWIVFSDEPLAFEEALARMRRRLAGEGPASSTGAESETYLRLMEFPKEAGAP